MTTPPKLQDAQLAIVGLGLMGGSLALALRGKCRRIVGVARRSETVTAARERAVVDEATTDPLAGVRGADIVVLATPVRTIIQQIEELGPHLADGCLLLDLGSTKTEIVETMARLPAAVQAIGGHPMCGKERAGLDVAEAGLYHDKTFILCAPKNACSQAMDRAKALVRAIGARCLEMDAHRHDRLVATISHLPYLLSSGLVAIAAEEADNDPLLSQVVASGFRDTSRLAGSDVRMMHDILMTNRRAVLETLTHCQAWLRELSLKIVADDQAGIQEILNDIQRRQKELRV